MREQEKNNNKLGTEMVRSPSVDKNGLKRGAWSEEEDNKLRAYIERYGHWNWRQLPKFAGIARCGKSCRLRWLNYLRPGLKKGSYSKEEEEIIIKLREELGNKWSTIAEKLPGRTDNEIKNYWNSHVKKLMQRDKKSTGKTEEISQNMLVMDQNEQQDYSVSHSESTDQKIELNVEVAAASVEEISSSSYDYSTPLDGAENSFTSEESFPKFFESFWTEPFYPSTSYNQISSPTSYNSRVLDLENWATENGISLEESLVESFQSLSTEPVSSNASDGLISSSTSSNSTVTNWTETVYSNPSKDLISPSTSHNSTIINSEETYADAFGGFWTEPFSLDTSNNLSILPQLPPAEGVMFSSTSFLEYDLDLFNQF